MRGYEVSQMIIGSGTLELYLFGHLCLFIDFIK